MDLDAYVGARSRQWGRLEHLVQQRRLTGAEGDELLELYQQVSTDLSVVRSASPDPSVVAYLSMLLTRARLCDGGDADQHLVGRPAASSPAPSRPRSTAPAAGGSPVRCSTSRSPSGWRCGRCGTPRSTPASCPRPRCRPTSSTDFANYYREFPHHEFATLVWVNNAWVAAQCIAFGVLGLPVLYVLAQNTVNVGVIGALMAGNDRTSLFFGLILPHGLLELTAVFVAGATGLRLFWSWVEPGPRTEAAGARRRGPHGRRHRDGAGRGAARERRHRGVRHAVGPADLGAGRASGSRPSCCSSPTCSWSAAGPTTTARRATSTPATWATPRPSPPDAPACPASLRVSADARIRGAGKVLLRSLEAGRCGPRSR